MCDIKKYILKEIVRSEVHKHLDINYLFIDTKRYPSDCSLLIVSSEDDIINFSRATVIKADPNHMRIECINMKTKYDKPDSTQKIDKKKGNKVICIMDEFSSECFSYELELTHLTKDNIETINQYDYDFFLCESAWHGYNGDWSGRLTNFDKNSDLKLKNFMYIISCR